MVLISTMVGMDVLFMCRVAPCKLGKVTVCFVLVSSLSGTVSCNTFKQKQQVPCLCFTLKDIISCTVVGCDNLQCIPAESKIKDTWIGTLGSSILDRCVLTSWGIIGAEDEEALLMVNTLI